MEYRTVANKPQGLRAIKLPNQFRNSHFIDAQDQLWWYVPSAIRLYGRRYYKDYYLKEAVYYIGSQKYTLTQLKELL